MNLLLFCRSISFSPPAILALPRAAWHTSFSVLLLPLPCSLQAPFARLRSCWLGCLSAQFWVCSLGAFFLLLKTLFTPPALNKILLALQLKAAAS